MTVNSPERDEARARCSPLFSFNVNPWGISTEKLKVSLTNELSPSTVFLTTLGLIGLSRQRWKTEVASVFTDGACLMLRTGAGGGQLPHWATSFGAKSKRASNADINFKFLISFSFQGE